MREALLGLLSAVRFLTVLPVPGPETDLTRRHSYVWFPVVGLGLGVVSGGAFALGHLAAPVSAVAAVVALAALTGALHLDGLADCADSLGAHDREKRLAVMRDSRLGTFGAVALVGVLLAKAAALWQAAPADALRWLVTAGALSRSAPLVLAASSAYARREGIGVTFVAGVGPAVATLAALVSTIVAALTVGPASALAATGVAVVVVAVIRWWANARLGGLTGDVMGASVELTEVSVLCVCALWR